MRDIKLQKLFGIFFLIFFSKLKIALYILTYSETHPQFNEYIGNRLFNKEIRNGPQAVAVTCVP